GESGSGARAVAGRWSAGQHAPRRDGMHQLHRPSLPGASRRLRGDRPDPQRLAPTAGWAAPSRLATPEDALQRLAHWTSLGRGSSLQRGDGPGEGPGDERAAPVRFRLTTRGGSALAARQARVAQYCSPAVRMTRFRSWGSGVRSLDAGPDRPQLGRRAVPWLTPTTAFS